MYKDKKIGVVVPAYNEQDFIGQVISRIPDYIDCIYIIDDGSQDATYRIATSLADRDRERMRVIQHKMNCGVGKTIVNGYKGCLSQGMDIVAVMAGDNQMDPLQLQKLLEPIISGDSDYTVGDRISRIQHMQGMSYWRRCGNWILKWLTRIAAGNLAIRDPQNGYTAIRCETLKRLNLDKIYPRYGYCNDLLIKLSATRARIKHVAMPAVYGAEKSKIKYRYYIPAVSWLLLRGFFWRLRFQIWQKGEM